MKRAMLIFLTLVLALVGWRTVCADDGFYVISGVKPNYAPVPKTGQTTSYDTPDHRDDGGLQKGVASRTPRFTDNKNGTVTDNLTGLIWLQDANALGTVNWTPGLNLADGLASGSGDLTDGSNAGDWRLPNVKELQSLLDYGRYHPALPADHPFKNVSSDVPYWSSTTNNFNTAYAWIVYLGSGHVDADQKTPSNYIVWCVRGGK